MGNIIYAGILKMPPRCAYKGRLEERDDCESYWGPCFILKGPARGGVGTMTDFIVNCQEL